MDGEASEHIIFPVMQGELKRLGIESDELVSAVVNKGALAYGIDQWQKLEKPHPIYSECGSQFVKKLIGDRKHLRTVLNVEIDRKRNLNWFQRAVCRAVGISVVKKGDYNE